MFPRLLRGPQRAIMNGVCVYGKQPPSPLPLCRTSAVAKSSNAFRSFTRHQPFSSGPRNASPSHNPPNTETSTLEITRKAYEKAYAAHRRALLLDKQRLKEAFKQRISKVEAEMAEIERARRVNMTATKGHNQPEQPRLKIDNDFVRRMPADLNFSSRTPNESREKLSNKDALEATKKAYEAHRLALQRETPRKLDAAKEQFRKDIETHLTELGCATPGRNTTQSVLDLIRRKPLVAVDLHERASTCKEYVQKLERAAAWKKELRAGRWGRIRDVGYFVVMVLALDTVLDSVLDHYGIRHARSPPAKTSEADEKGEEKESVTEAEVATVTAKESAA
ncbi:hypothetical protein GCG54_00009280 [Colletotrichum gloeosporioides]|uniref:Uncharacterized protein n=1 Tax=Colletotrichum gloeosporioides TaxID=474922 RepID=A0A8H4C567_COLGL|nr:uncharacterized protein GCG54_00009280 [Colletotrichum gloeosporioides]KAF3797309.1 hypothetical protein GCG54_00009280 [Colletotrichum gloeosporioides]